MTSRDDFTSRVKDTLAKRVGFRCSNPSCRTLTSGPHLDVDRSVSIGVACHITAAAPGGPRYDSTLSPSERAAILNGIWLCQTCAKLIDSNEEFYTMELLREWKRGAEFNADAELTGRHPSDYLPQPSMAVHSPIPHIAGLTYHDARRRLLEAGWQPRMRHWSHTNTLNLQSGNGAEFWGRDYREIINAWPTGLAQCTFAFRDVYGNNLTIMTHGEEEPAQGRYARVSNWFFEK